MSELVFYCVTSEINLDAWDIMDSEGKRYRWGGDLSGALTEAARLEKLAEEMTSAVE